MGAPEMAVMKDVEIGVTLRGRSQCDFCLRMAVQKSSKVAAG
jgi:hypothetical protein